MSTSIKNLAKESLKTFFSNKEGYKDKIEEFLDYLNDRLIIVSLLETAKFGNYPFKWLSADQKNFLNNGGELWLSYFAGVEYPIYSRDEDYSDLSFVYFINEFNKIKAHLDLEIDLSEISPASVDRFIRIKIIPESYRNFKYIFMPVFIIYGMNKGYFSKLNRKDFLVLERLSMLFLNRFLNEFINKAKNKKIENVSKDILEVVERIIRASGEKYDFIIGKLVTLKKLILSSERSLVSTDFSDEDSEQIRFIQDALKIIKKQYFPNFNKVMKEKIGVDVYNITYKLRKRYISKREYNKLKEEIYKIKEVPEISKAGVLFEKALELKAVKDRQIKQINVEKIDMDDNESKSAEKALNTLKEIGVINKDISKDSEERIKRVLVALKRLSYDKDLEDFATVKMYF